MSKKSEKLAKEQRLREAYEARVKAERNARVAQDVQRTNELAAQRKAKLDAWVDTRTPEQIKADRNRAIDYEKQSLDYVGLNIKGQSVEPEPEMKPLTDADKNMLDFVASQGASVQALAEIERDLRTAPVFKAPVRTGNYFGKPWPTQAEIAAKKDAALVERALKQMQTMIDLARDGYLADSEISRHVTSVFLAFPAQTPVVLDILRRWKVPQHDLIDPRAADELEALLPLFNVRNLVGV